ncbi:MAG: hypothetical protein INQ03_09135 [Candidatus Heimdallarchaeota archaeon]|nr:hypothetical protein [Candidatus Heimdallarchaeota archaeon]
MKCSYCNEKEAQVDRIFPLGTGEVGFCSDQCTDDFKRHLSVKEQRLIRSYLCCPNANHIISRGYLVCKNCGTVVDDYILDSGPEFVKRENISIKELETYYSFYTFLVE